LPCDGTPCGLNFPCSLPHTTFCEPQQRAFIPRPDRLHVFKLTFHSLPQSIHAPGNFLGKFRPRCDLFPFTGCRDLLPRGQEDPLRSTGHLQFSAHSPAREPHIHSGRFRSNLAQACHVLRDRVDVQSSEGTKSGNGGIFSIFLNWWVSPYLSPPFHSLPCSHKSSEIFKQFLFLYSDRQYTARPWDCRARTRSLTRIRSPDLLKNEKTANRVRRRAQNHIQLVTHCVSIAWAESGCTSVRNVPGPNLFHVLHTDKLFGYSAVF
jgi:hypothetical protein